MIDKNKRLLLVIFYEGPWDRLANFFWGVRRSDQELRWDIPQKPRGIHWLLYQAATFCDNRDRLWVNKHVREGRDPHRMWKRQVRNEANP